MDELIKQLLCYLKVTGRMFLKYWKSLSFKGEGFSFNIMESNED